MVSEGEDVRVKVVSVSCRPWLFLFPSPSSSLSASTSFVTQSLAFFLDGRRKALAELEGALNGGDSALRTALQAWKQVGPLEHNGVNISNLTVEWQQKADTIEEQAEAKLNPDMKVGVLTHPPPATPEVPGSITTQL